MTRFVLGVMLAVSTVLVAGCASSPKVFSQVAPGTDFYSYQTFAFYPELATDNASYESMTTNFLKVAVAQEMSLRGMRYDAQNPDLLVNFFLNTKEKVTSRSVPTASMGGYYGWRDPFYQPWGGYAYETRIDQYTEGTLNIDVADVSQQKLVWEGSTVGRITDEVIRNLEKHIDLAVNDIFKQYPIQGPEES